jgi:hypothetical protein
MTGVNLPTSDIIAPDGLIRAPLSLVGIEGSAGRILALVVLALREAGNSREVVNAWRAEALSGDFNHLLRAAMVYTEDPGDDE